MSDYIFYLTNESFDYPTGYGTDTETQWMPHGFEIEDLDMETFNAYGNYLEMNDKCKTLEDLRDYILSHYKEIQYINETKRELYTETRYKDETKDNWTNFDILLAELGKRIKELKAGEE